jgi:hypothetical protein
VLMRDKEAPRNDWPLARVSKTFPSQDGNVRKVEVETAREDRKNRYLRPVTELVLLRTAEQLASSNDDER